MSRDDLADFMELFCYGSPYYVMTRERADDWFTSRWRLTQTQVLTHLLGNVLPNSIPRWVAPKSCGRTRVIGIDVDYHPGEEDDFRRRQGVVRRVLRELGIDRESILVSETPSGGTHYRFFLTRPIDCDAIAPVMENMGIVHRRGEFELFPSKTCGYRLPFGLVPGKEHQLTRAGEFIRRFRRGQIQQVDWRRCVRRAEAYANQHHRPQQNNDPSRLRTINDSSKAKTHSEPATTGVRKCGSQRMFPPACVASGSDVNCIDESARRASVERLWHDGIQTAGTRTESTLALAWHLRFVRGLTEEESAEMLVEWVYRTGRTTSTTVMWDNARGTRRAEQQTLDLVRWIAQLPDTRPKRTVGRHRISKTEVEAILKHLQFAAKADQVELLEFSLEFLNFCKRHGQAGDVGWTAEIAAAEVMRRWRRCSGRWYKVKRDKLETIGLVKAVRGEWKRAKGTGRARTYHMAVPAVLSTGAEMTVPEALAYGATLIDLAVADQASNTGGENKNDSKEEIVKNNLSLELILGDRGRAGGSLAEQRLEQPSAARSGTNSVPQASTTGITSCLRQEYASHRRELLSLSRPTRRPAGRVNIPEPTPPPAVHCPFLDLPLRSECRDWLLRNSGKAMGIPKRYQLMIAAAQREAATSGRMAPSTFPERRPGPSFPGLAEPPTCQGVFPDERLVPDLALGFS